MSSSLKEGHLFFPQPERYVSGPGASSVTHGEDQSGLTAYKLNTATYTSNNEFFGHWVKNPKQETKEPFSKRN